MSIRKKVKAVDTHEMAEKLYNLYDKWDKADYTVEDAEYAITHTPEAVIEYLLERIEELL